MSGINRLKKRWEKLKYWQKGAIVGGGGHVLSVLLIYSLAVIFVGTSSSPNSGDMGSIHVWILVGLSVLVEFIPSSVLHFLGDFEGIETTILAYSGPHGDTRSILIWFFYMAYSTAIYAIIGIVLARSIEYFK